jgi:FMN-dependent NADH-azoreductase
MKILHVDSSALGTHSVSRQLSAHIVAGLKADMPSSDVQHLDLAEHPLPHWTPNATGAEDSVVTLENDILTEFIEADVVVIGAPMYNFTISSQLKAWLDRVLVAGRTFRYTANGPEGLMGGKRVIVALSRGGFYGQGTAAAAMDFQEPYLRAVFAFVGIDNVEFVRAEGIALGEEQRNAAVLTAQRDIEKLFSPKLARAA